MTWPIEYQRAAFDFEDFMVTARDAASLATTNLSWTMVQGVFFTFRQRLTAKQGIEFANAMPPLVRALFLDGWKPKDQPLPFSSLEEMTLEVQSLRSEHNFSPANAIESVSKALRFIIGEQEFSRALSKLPAEAADFWWLLGNQSTHDQQRQSAA